MQPFVQATSNEFSAKLSRQFHPLRWQRWAMSDLNPWMSWVGSAAEMVRAQRRPVDKDNMALKLEKAGSTVISASLDYYRAVKGVRDTTEMYAVSRPRIEYFARDSADSARAPADSAGRTRAEPYVIVADRVRIKGDDRIWAGGKVTVDRSDFAARGDSLRLDTPDRTRMAAARADRSSGNFTIFAEQSTQGQGVLSGVRPGDPVKSSRGGGRSRCQQSSQPSRRQGQPPTER